MHILPHFYPRLLCPLYHSFIIYFYVRWPGLHPYLVFDISFSYLPGRVCQCISSVHLSSLVFPFYIAYYLFASLFWPLFPIFTPLIFLMLFQFGPRIMLDCVTLFLEFYHFSADFMFIWSLLMLVILPDWFLLYIYCFVLVFHLTLYHFTYIGAHHICICGEIYSLAM